MKATIKIVAISILFLALSGCSAQKRAAGADAAALHAQAVQALAQRRFILEADEFFFPGSKTPVAAVDSSISLAGDRAQVDFVQAVFPKENIDHLRFTDSAAELSEEKARKNGDRLFCLRLRGGQNWQNRKIVITLYADSNRCYVQVSNELLGYPIADFRGHVRPCAK